MPESVTCNAIYKKSRHFTRCKQQSFPVYVETTRTASGYGRVGRICREGHFQIDMAMLALAFAIPEGVLCKDCAQKETQ